MDDLEDHLEAVLGGSGYYAVWGETQHRATGPYFRLTQMSGRRERQLDGLGPIKGRVQVDCFGRNSAEARALKKAAKAVLENYRGGPIMGVLLDVERGPIPGDPGDLSRISLTFSVTYRD